MPKAEYIKCVTRCLPEGEPKVTWCGERVAFDWVFGGLDHVALMKNERLMPCRHCIAAAKKYLTSIAKGEMD